MRYNHRMQQLLLVYGKIIVDSIRLRSGALVRSQLGGGGPQAAFGARLWHAPVALLTRSGTNLEPEHEQALRQLDLDLDGWMRADDLPTPRGLMEYDQDEYLHSHGIQTSRAAWFELLARPIPLTPRHQQAAGIHLITEFADEPMVVSARDLQRRGAFVSLEPIFADHSCTDPAALFGLVRQVDIVTPDWPAATAFAASDQPAEVLRFWATLGPAAVAIRHGAHGSYVWNRASDQAWHIPALTVPLVDPTGAGNAYGGGWCAGWQHTQDARVAGCYGTVAAALTVSCAGMPALSEAARQQAAALLDQALAACRVL